MNKIVKTKVIKQRVTWGVEAVTDSDRKHEGVVVSLVRTQEEAQGSTRKKRMA